VPPFDQCAEMLLERIATGTGQFDGLADRDSSMLAGKLENLKREFGLDLQVGQQPLDLPIGQLAALDPSGPWGKP